MKLLKNLRGSEELLRRAAKGWDDIFVTVQDGGDKSVVDIAGDDPLAVTHAAAL